MTVTVPFTASEALNWLWSNREWLGAIAGGVIAIIGGRFLFDRRQTVYKQSKEEGHVDFEVFRSPTYVENMPVGDAGQGDVAALKNGIIEIRRTNTEGRVGLRFLDFRIGNKHSTYIPQRPEAESQRFFIVKFEARARNAEHHLRLVLRTYLKESEFVHGVVLSVRPDEWQKFSRVLISPSDKDLRFFLESSAQDSRGSVQVRNLVVAERLSAAYFGWLTKLLRSSRHQDE